MSTENPREVAELLRQTAAVAERLRKENAELKAQLKTDRSETAPASAVSVKRTPQVKALRFNRIVEMMRELSPPERFDMLLATLSPNTRDLIIRAPAATTWLSIAPLDELFRRSLEVCYQNELSRVFQQGRLSFIRDVKSVYKMFIKFLSPSYIIQKSSRIWETYYRDNGSLRVTDVLQYELQVVYADVLLGSPAFWEQSRGTLHGAMEATGMADVNVEVVDGGDEAKHCRFRVSWR